MREGGTNVLRHARAATCSILGGRDDGTVWLEIVNDGADRTPDRPAGHGLTGLAERVRTVCGELSTTSSEGRFRLLVEIPELAPGRTPTAGARHPATD